MLSIKAGLTLLLVLLLTGGGHQPPPDLEQGREIYLKRCKVCHGERGDTDRFVADVLNPPPRNFTAAQSRQELTEERMIQSVTHGRPGTAMMPWKDNLTPGEIRAVVHYIRKTLMQLED